MISVQHSLGTCWMCFVSSSCFHILKTPTSWHTCWIFLTCWIWTWSGFLQVALDQCFQINAHPFAAYLRCCSQIALVKHGKAPRPNIPSKSLVIQFALCCGWLDCSKKSATKWVQHDKWQYMAIHQPVAMPILPSPSATRRWSSAGFHGSWWICQSCHWFGECGNEDEDEDEDDEDDDEHPKGYISGITWYPQVVPSMAGEKSQRLMVNHGNPLVN